eukprot:CAMPEP_0203958680 /NCGR_PEP_ID=MMETSP0359-20131031/90030_1 /ASSEMBLY_ACC=CAM_ASM_000338 /TAXON_ID=268821 /ORGANISM="Scrippsiella Hangoei, Strain SHTV-5" /LENGTH=93 /DNA_ID=CAMNT_0050892661 /DNA_START=18 /DNA_END=296 /DNA_ORIENTATION=+
MGKTMRISILTERQASELQRRVWLSLHKASTGSEVRYHNMILLQPPTAASALVATATACEAAATLALVLAETLALVLALSFDLALALTLVLAF